MTQTEAGLSIQRTLPAASGLPSAFSSQTSSQPSPSSQASRELKDRPPPRTTRLPRALRNLPQAQKFRALGTAAGRPRAPAHALWLDQGLVKAARVKNPLLQILEVTRDNWYKNSSSAGGMKELSGN